MATFPVLFMQTFEGSGYVAYGYTPNWKIFGYDFSSETGRSVSSGLNGATEGTVGWNSAANGYSATGYTSTLSNRTGEIRRLAFSGEISSTLSAALSARWGGCGVNSRARAYALGGYTTTLSSEIDGIIFSGETYNNPSAVLGTARYHMASVGSEDRGYAMGGIVDYTYITPTNAVDGITYSSETAYDPSAAIASRREPTGFNSKTVGYAAGGYIGGISTEIDGITFSNDAYYNPSAVLSTSTSQAYGLNTYTRAYIVKAVTSGIPVDCLVFATDTSCRSCASLSAPPSFGGGYYQSGGYL